MGRRVHGIIKYISTLFERKQWKSIFLTLTQPRNKFNINSSNSSKAQSPSSWMLSAHNANMSTPSSPTHPVSAFAPTANSFSASQREEKASLPSEPHGERRVTENYSNCICM